VRVEFHCHTHASNDSLTTPQQLVETCRQKGIDRVVITDHNTTAGALQAKALDPERVIVGEEIKTTQGELLAAYVQEEIPPRLTPMETIQRLRNQGAFISVSHPFDHQRYGWQVHELMEILPLVDAIEVFNARCYNPVYNTQAQNFARQHNLAVTVGSDAHAAFELGKATLVLPSFGNAEELKSIIRQGRIKATMSPAWVHLVSVWARWRKHSSSKR
jgi:hypothetical protein